MIFAFVEDGTLTVHEDLASVQREYEGVDVESKVVHFYDEQGVFLEPKFVVPNREGKVLGLFGWVSSGVFQLIPNANAAQDSFAVALYEASSLAPNPWFESLAHLKSELSARGVPVTSLRPSKLKRVPTEKDWRSVPWCLDIPFAYDHFFGKTHLEAVQLFEENAIAYLDDLHHMPRPCLEYYLDAYVDYLLSERSACDSDGASFFFGLVETRIDDIKTFPFGTVERVKLVLEKLATHQSWYAADREIYGDFSTKAKQMFGLLNSKD